MTCHHRQSFYWPFIAVGLLAACQSGSPSEPLSMKTDKKPTDVVVAIAKIAQTCWFKSGDPVFKPYKLANETNSYGGRPRFLLVKRNNPSGLPLLVVQAETKGSASSGKYTNIQTFGPLLETSNGKRISEDVRRWSSGNSSCAA